VRVVRERIDAVAKAAHDCTTEQLGKNAHAGACATVCRRLAEVVDSESAAAKEAGAAIACAPGCTFCCHQRVSVFPHEAVALFEFLRTSSPPAQAAVIEQRIRENARRIDGMTVREHYAANVRCAFLVDGRCAAYAVRPSACAGYHSMSRERCEHAYRHAHDLGTPKTSRPALRELQELGDALVAATRAGLDAAGLASAKTELHRSLQTLLDDPSAGERWRAGGDVPGAS
jgi:Fe-S-cluster containining protein